MIYYYMGRGGASTTDSLSKLTDLQIDASQAQEIIIDFKKKDIVLSNL